MAQKKIVVLHSFPQKELKFRHLIDYLYGESEYENIIVSSLNDCDPAIIEEIDVVVIHFLKDGDVEFLIKYDISKPVVWNAWGQDIYRLDKIYHKILLQKTKNKFLKVLYRESKSTFIKEFVKLVLPNVYRYTAPNQKRIKAFGKIDYINPVVPGDYEIVKNNYDIDCKIAYNKGIPTLTKKSSHDQVYGRNILLGNSASVSNNHFEIIDILSQLDLQQENRKVVIPLSYGGVSVRYVDEIQNYINRKLGSSNVLILRDFMPFDEYNRIVLSCECVVMNHVRQQGMGNVLMSIIQGGHVYLREESSVYKFLTDQGMIISKIGNDIIFRSLNDEEKFTNMNILKKIYDPQKIYKDQYDFFIGLSRVSNNKYP